MKIEVLYSEVGNLFGDLYNIEYLKKFVDCKVFYTDLNAEPKFVKEKIDLIYLGPMTEKQQDIAVGKLLKYKDKIKSLIDEKVYFLVTGNAVELFGKYILNEDESKVECLGIFDFYSKRDFSKHHISYFLGEFKDMELVGFKSQFSHSYDLDKGFIDVIRGYGFDGKSKKEGIYYKNFIGTYLIGPILILNPYFTKWLLKRMNLPDKLLYEADLIKAYEVRLKEFKDDRLKV